MQSLISFASLIGLSIVLVATWILPLFNLHIGLGRETRLQEQAQLIIDSNRINPTTTLDLLRAIDLVGVDIDEVRAETQGDYIIYSIDFNHNGLFSNKFLSREDLNRTKTIGILSDLV